MLSGMDDAFVDWAKRQIADWEARIPWLESRRVTMGETRDGKHVDTTQEHVDDLRRWVSELQDLVSQHEARDA